ncbi:hypothetical protein SO802_011267 [Lithocarpus litseifolius]|uniref:DUF4283 domain-containing protein n=1 Tax=Lithocarpus litseifolius TaxID=425828 RepID=A0AAW2D3A0_9ROSI
MDSDFVTRIQSLNLTEDEDEVIIVGRSQRGKIPEECSLSLLGRFLTNRPYNQRAAKSLLQSVWKLGADLKIIDDREGLFQFKFTLESQLMWVMNNGPWSFNGNILVLRRWEIGMTASSVTFPVLLIWIQIRGLPFDLVSEEVGREIESGMGRVVELDTKAFTAEQAQFIRVRVEIPLDKPIRRGGSVLNLEGSKTRIGFKYERLVGLCFQCGRFGHERRSRTASRDRHEAETPYGEWLRADTKAKEGHGVAEGGFKPRQTRSAPWSETALEKGQANRFPSQSVVRAMPRQTEALNENNTKSSNGNILADSKDVRSQKSLTTELLRTKILGLDSLMQKTADHTIKAPNPNL